MASNIPARHGVPEEFALYRKPCVLIVDDEVDAISLLQRTLRADCEVLVAVDAHAGLRALGERPVDLIISDVRMPGMNGLDFLCEAARVQPEAWRVMVTAFGEPPLLMRAINEGHIHHYAAKPYRPEDLRSIVVQLIRTPRAEPPVPEPVGRPCVVVVDDESDNLDLAVRALRGQCQVLVAHEGETALTLLSRHSVDVIVADHRMPTMTGVELLRVVARRWPRTKRVLMSAYGDAEVLARAITEARVHYYEKKPWDVDELRRTVADFIQSRARGTPAAWRRFGDAPAVAPGETDPSIAQAVTVDPLTELLARAAFETQLRALVDVRAESPVTLVLFDVDNLSVVNAAEGTAAGDRLLRAAASLLRLSTGAAATDRTLGRLHGGELGQILSDTDKRAALDHADRVRLSVESLAFRRDDGSLLPAATVSAGVAEIPTDADTVDGLWEAAGGALRRAKEQGRNRCEVCAPKLLICGKAPELREFADNVLARREFSTRVHSQAESLVQAARAWRPAVVLLDVDAPRRVLDDLAALAREPAFAGLRVLLATARGPDPSWVSRAARVPGSQLVMGPTRFAGRLSETIAGTLGVKVRRHLRGPAPLAARVAITEAGPVLDGHLINVSESGSKIMLPQALSVGDRVRVAFPVRESSLDLRSSVVRVLRTPAGAFEVGLRFEDVSPADAEILRSFVAEAVPLVAGPAGLGAVALATAAPGPAAVEAGTIFELSGVWRAFESTTALMGVSLAIRPGERIVVIGPSGAGKTTLLRLLNTSMTPSRGEVRVFGVDPSAQSPRGLRRMRARIATIYQQYNLVPETTVLHNVVAGQLGRVSLWRTLAAMVRTADADRVAGVLDRMGIAGKIYERVDRLSGGEQQRVAIARALYQDPDVILADEPLASVDPARSAEIVDLLLQAGGRRTLIVCTHQLEPVLPYFERVVGLRDGQVLFDKRRAEVSLDDLARVYASERAAPARPLRSFSPVPAAPAGVLNIGASSIPGEFILPRIVGHFARDSPGVRVQLSVKDSRAVTEDLLAGRLALAFVGARVPHPDLHFEDFADDEIVLVIASNYSGLPPEPLPGSLVSRLPRVEREAGSGTRAVVEDYFANMNQPLDPKAVVFEAGTVQAVKAAVIEGIGVAFMSRVTVEAEIRAGLLRSPAVDTVKVPRRLFVAWRKADELSLAARRFLSVAKGVMPALGRDGEP